MLKLVTSVLCLSLCSAQIQSPIHNEYLNNDRLSEKIGNFSLDLLYQTSLTVQDAQNMFISPVTLWSVLAAVSEGAFGDTKHEIINAIRFNTYLSDAGHGYLNIVKWLKGNRGKLYKMNAMLIDGSYLPSEEFKLTALSFYQSTVLWSDFKNNVNVTNEMNEYLADWSNGKIKGWLKPEYLRDAPMVLVSALYFKGFWTVPFNVSSTARMPFYDSNGRTIGEVNMMHNKFTYGFANFRELQGRVIELPFDNENKLTMLIMVPNIGVSVENIFRNLQKIALSTIFEKLKASLEENSNNGVDCFIPRFNIASDLDLTDIFKNSFGIKQLFEPFRARLPYVAQTPLYASKIFHKAQIDVTEESETDPDNIVKIPEYSNSTDLSFRVNRPFALLIVEKNTNSIIFGGFYRRPSMY